MIYKSRINVTFDLRFLKIFRWFNDGGNRYVDERKIYRNHVFKEVSVLFILNNYYYDWYWDYILFFIFINFLTGTYVRVKHHFQNKSNAKENYLFYILKVNRLHTRVYDLFQWHLEFDIE